MSETAKEVAFEAAKILAVAALASAVLACVFAAGFRAGWERGRADTIQAVKPLVMALGGCRAAARPWGAGDAGRPAVRRGDGRRRGGGQAPRRVVDAQGEHFR